jgi:flagellar protein FliS
MTQEAATVTTAGYNAYKTAEITTADPVTLTTMLFDGAIKAMKKARIFHESGNREGFLEQADRAHLIVGELLATLDMEQGDLPKTLSGLYAYCMRAIVESTLGDLSKLDDAELHITRIAAAWKQATASLREAVEGQAFTGAAA